MKLNSDIQKKFKFILKTGFSIVDFQDLGMAKWSRLSSPEFDIIIWNDRDDIDVILEKNDKTFNLFSLVKFLYEDVKFTNVASEIKLEFIDNIIEKKYNNILDFLSHLTDSQYKEYEEFHKTEILSSLP